MIPGGDLRIYVFGKITYEDAFGGHRHTMFCHAYFGPERFDLGKGNYRYEPWQAKSCDRHKEAD
jgi:hypothetical protein